MSSYLTPSRRGVIFRMLDISVQQRVDIPHNIPFSYTVDRHAGLYINHIAGVVNKSDFLGSLFSFLFVVYGEDNSFP